MELEFVKRKLFKKYAKKTQNIVKKTKILTMKNIATRNEA